MICQHDLAIGAPQTSHSFKHLLCSLINQRLQSSHAADGEKAIQRRSSPSVLVMSNGRKSRLWDRKRLGVPFPLVAFLAARARSVQGVVVMRVGDVQFVRVDANDGAIFGMQIPNMERVLAAEDDVVVELVP